MFVPFQISLVNINKIIRVLPPTVLLRIILLPAAASLLAAGIFPLGSATEIHVALMAVSFVFIVLSMYLLPRCVEAFKSKLHTFVFCSSGLGTASFVVLGAGCYPGEYRPATCGMLCISLVVVAGGLFCCREVIGK